MRKAEPFVAATPGELLVVFLPHTTKAAQDWVLAPLRIVDHRPRVAACVVKVTPGQEPFFIDQLSRNAFVQFVQLHHHIGMTHSPGDSH